MKQPAMPMIVAGVLMLPACAAPPARPTPGATPAAAVATFASAIGDRNALGDRAVTPLEVVEDSRCPANVRCIQAGTVRLRLRLQERGESREAIVGLERPARLAGAWLHLLGVCPARIVPDAPAARDYRFTFAITTAADRPAVQVPCP